MRRRQSRRRAPGPPTSAADLWKRYRKGEREFRGAHLEGEDLSVGLDPDDFSLEGIDLSGSGLSSANLSGLIMDGACLRGSGFAGADLSSVALPKADLRGAFLLEANLHGADLQQSNLQGADLTWATLRGVDLRGANLSAADLSGCALNGAMLSGADLKATDLDGANLSNADLSGADLRGANLLGAILMNASLKRADLTGAYLADAVLTNADLTGAIGLDAVRHVGPSSLDQRTLVRSGPLVPEFLRGLGFADWEIESARLVRSDLASSEIGEVLAYVQGLRGRHAVQRRPILVSHSVADMELAASLKTEMAREGIRVWQDARDSGAEPRSIEAIVEKAVAERDVVKDRLVVLVLSTNSVESAWARREIHKARKIRREQKRVVIFPVALDESWKKQWSNPYRTQVDKLNVLDFSGWRDPNRRSQTFGRLASAIRQARP